MNLYKSMEDGDNPIFSGKILENSSTWPAEYKSQVRPSRWHTHFQLHFLIINTLKPPLLSNWLPHADEDPQVHFERLLNEVKFWSGEQSA